MLTSNIGELEIQINKKSFQMGKFMNDQITEASYMYINTLFYTKQIKLEVCIKLLLEYKCVVLIPNI